MYDDNVDGDGDDYDDDDGDDDDDDGDGDVWQCCRNNFGHYFL